MMRGKPILHILVFASAIVTILATEDGESQDGLPEKKLISTFQIVRFPNDACVGSNARNGTCYTSAECSDKGGASSGSCADGFGVCCTFLINTCGSTSSENITYWDTPADTGYISTTLPSSCMLTVCPVNSNICQLRIDFTTFQITGPSTSATSEAHKQLGVVPHAGTVNTAVNWKTNCLVDHFGISGVSPANSPPGVCGTLTGSHMYVDANVENCNDLTFTFMPAAGPASAAATTGLDSRGISTLAKRDWDMTIYQYECGYTNAAPPGCTQYLFGPATGKVSSYNFGTTSVHLANQNQKICIRREKAYCYACFASDTILSSFSVSGKAGGDAFAYTIMGQPCGYRCANANGLGDAADQCAGYDCVIVPGAFTCGASATGIRTAGCTAANIRLLTAAAYQVPAGPQISGSGGVFGSGNADSNAITNAGAATQQSICTKHVPFQLTFKSDDFEGTGPDGEHLGTAGEQTGFSLNYALVTCAA